MPETSTTTTPHTLSKQDLEALSAFRYQLRRFLKFSEEIIHAHDITSQQYLLMLHVRGFPDREYASVGELAERLQLVPHGALALVQRCEKRGLVQRQPSEHDKRTVLVSLTDAGNQILEQLAYLHKEELTSVGKHFHLPFEHPFTTTERNTDSI
jgi:DNA-binding MarR family transcriptional regulator